MSVALAYSMIIQWSDEDKVYIAQLPEFGPGAKTHGETYEEAAKMGREVIEMLVESYIADGEPLPLPQKFVDVDDAPATKFRRPTRRPRASFKTAKSTNK
jgi:antitoxin HicB